MSGTNQGCETLNPLILAEISATPTGGGIDSIPVHENRRNHETLAPPTTMVCAWF